MNDLKLKKKSWLRRRFIVSPPLKSLNDWFDTYQGMKEQILTSSAFQLVGHMGVLEIESNSKTGRVLVEVVGVPRIGFLSKDIEAQEVLVFEHPRSAFEVDFLTLNQEARAIISEIRGSISDTYHIVFDGRNLALHFFI